MSPEAIAAIETRPLILHYHLFKNAGTSIDALLRMNFPSGWMEKEFPTDAVQGNSALVADFIGGQPELAALASHTALLPLPAVAGRKIFPILFVRHPLLRLWSAYIFERQQQVDTFGANLAKKTDLAGYLKVLIENKGNRQLHNFHTSRLAFAYPQDTGTELERALRAVEALPFIGLVERYEQSLHVLRALLWPDFPDFKIKAFRKNASAEDDGSSPQEKIATLRGLLGDSFFSEIVEANADDLRIFDLVAQRYGASFEEPA